LINVKLNENVVKEEPLDEDHYDSVDEEHQPDDSSSSSSNDGSQINLIQSQFTNDSKPIRYQMLGAPTLVYRHAPSYQDPSSWPTPLTPSQIEMALYLKDHPVGSWFKGVHLNIGEAYPQSIQQYLPKQMNARNAINSVVDVLHHVNRERVRGTTPDLPMQSGTSSSLQDKQGILERERIKWLEWKLYRWECKDQKRKDRMMAFKALHEYHIERDMRKLVHCWERKDEDENVRRERRRQRRRAKRKARGDDRGGGNTFSWEPRQTLSSSGAADDKLAGLELPVESPLIDESSISSNDSNISDSSAFSSWSSSISSMCTYYSDESAFHRWEEKMLIELHGAPDSVDCPEDEDDGEKKRKLLFSWVFDGDPSRDEDLNRTSQGGEHQYSLNDLVEMLEQRYGKDNSLQATEFDIAPIPRREVEVEDIQQDKIGGASSYGNCLVILKCTCPSCQIDITKQSDHLKDRKLPNFFLVRPTGKTLSSVAISKIRFPRDTPTNHDYDNNAVDINGKILQVSVCGKSAAASHRAICLVARTAIHCCVLVAQPQAVKCNSHGKYDCPAVFTLAEQARIDLRSSQLANQPSYLPFYVTCDPKTSISFFTNPSFAILCLSETESKTAIQYVTFREQTQIKCHDLSSELSDISIIEFDPRDRLVLWAAARPRKMSVVSKRFFKRGGSRGQNKGALVEGLTGYGHSLYRIDLRDDSVTFAWSPSHEEYLVDGVFSISGILPDTSRDHILWISSTSAGKTWALDVRYRKPKVLVSWSLPSLCDDLGPNCSATGIHGAGVLMSQCSQHLSPTDVSPPMFGIKKDINASTLNAFQFPSSMPRFQTRPLESAGFVEVPKTLYDTTSIARSTTFALPDIDEKIFNIGLALVELPSLTALNEKKLTQLGYKAAPARSVYAFTMTSIGDVYCHVLLACDVSEEMKSKFFPGLPVGITALPVPQPRRSKKRKFEEQSCEMAVVLSNVFPVPASAVAQYSSHYEEAFNLQSICLNQINTRSRDDGGISNSTNFETVANQQLPCPFHDLDLSAQLTNNRFSTLMMNKRLKSDSHGVINQNYLNRKVALPHSTLGFRLLAPNDVTSPNGQQWHHASNDITLQNKHFLVTVDQRQQDEIHMTRSRSSDVKVGDLSTDMLERLNYRYFNSNTNQSDTPVKEDPYFSDEYAGEDPYFSDEYAGEA
jgi:hypothetical protein